MPDDLTARFEAEVGHADRQLEGPRQETERRFTQVDGSLKHVASLVADFPLPLRSASNTSWPWHLRLGDGPGGKPPRPSRPHATAEWYLVNEEIP